MRFRPVVLSLVVVSGLVLGACAGGTDPATNVTNVSAQLNAHGYSNDGPATWWWEYDTVQSDLGTANDTEVCGVGNGSKEPDNRCGPATGGSQSNPIPVNVVVTGLQSDTIYYFRACGQDTNDPSPTCANTRSFETLAGTSYAFDRKWGTLGSGNGQLSTPSGVATDSSGNVYVADQGNNRIQKFSSAGTFITKWGTPGTGNGQFNAPGGVGTDSSGNVYVADISNERIQKFSSTGTFITKWGTEGIGNGQFTGPTDVATDPAGNVYVPDLNTDRIQKFSSTGTFITSWGPGTSNESLRGPAGVATDSAANVYVAEAAGSDSRHRISKFSSTGTFIDDWCCFGSGDGEFWAPQAVATDASGNVYVADYGNNRIQKLSSTGTFITKWGSIGSGDGQFDGPNGVAVDSSGSVYVADRNNNRIQKFKPVE